MLTSTGSGDREMLISYTVAAPIWKTTYRVVLDGSGQPFFQGWAIIDNVSDEDWNEVSLSLVSGSPVSFIHPVQQPLYRYRRVIPLSQDLNLTPQLYDSVVGGVVGGVEGGTPGGIVGGVAGGVGSGSGGGSGPGRGYNTGGGSPPLAPAPVTTLSDAITGEESGVAAAATGNEVGDLFEYKIDQPISLRKDRSALIPILQTRMEGEPVSIYSETARADRPMSGLRLKNTSKLTLEAGSITVIEGDSYVGEALIERLKPGEERLISYAVDLGTLVTTNTKSDNRPAFLVRAINGVFQAHYYQTSTKTYTLTNQTDKRRTVYIEHPIRKDWKLAEESPRPAEKTAREYRFRVEVEPRGRVDLPVTEQLGLMTRYEISSLTPPDLEVFVSRRYLDDESRRALEGILDFKGKIASLDASAAALDREAGEIASDQERLRENVKALKDSSEARQLIARYISKAGEQETRLERLREERKSLMAERTRLQAQIETAIRGLSVERKLAAQ